MRLGSCVRGAAITVAICGLGLAQTDEIQVYDGGVAPRGVFNFTLHNNFTPKGQRSPGFAGGLPNDKNWNGVAEWAYGVTDWFEAGRILNSVTTPNIGMSVTTRPRSGRLSDGI